jgi:hypothetical protein
MRLWANLRKNTILPCYPLSLQNQFFIDMAQNLPNSMIIVFYHEMKKKIKCKNKKSK